MNKITMVSVLFLLLSQGTFSQISIFITNDTGADLYGVHASESDNPEWGDDLLPEDLFEIDSEVEIEFPESFDCIVDIKVTYDEDFDGTIDAEIEFLDIDICKIVGIKLYSDGSYDIYSQPSILISNDTGVDLYGLHASESDDPQWGEDLLPQELFEVDSEVEIEFPEGFDCIVDIKVTYDEDLDGTVDAEIEFLEIDICEIKGIILYSDGFYKVF